MYVCIRYMSEEEEKRKAKTKNLNFIFFFENFQRLKKSRDLYFFSNIGNVKMSKCQNFDIKWDSHTHTATQTDRLTNMGIHKAALRQLKSRFFLKISKVEQNLTF